MPTKKSAKPKSKQNPSGRRGLSLSLGDRSADDAVRAMFRIGPEASRKILEDTSPSPAPKKKSK